MRIRRARTDRVLKTGHFGFDKRQEWLAAARVRSVTFFGRGTTAIVAETTGLDGVAIVSGNLRTGRPRNVVAECVYTNARAYRSVALLRSGLG